MPITSFDPSALSRTQSGTLNVALLLVSTVGVPPSVRPQPPPVGSPITIAARLSCSTAVNSAAAEPTLRSTSTMSGPRQTPSSQGYCIGENTSFAHGLPRNAAG